MNFQSPDLLYQLLPEEYRNRDTAEGSPLRTLLQVISGHVTLVKEDIDQLYNNLFIETAEGWVIPYLGDLVGTLPLEGDPRRLRADVARTISYRRRKGTLAMLEEMAADVTGWQARAVDLFQQLGWTQNLNHLRPQALCTPDFRRPHERDRLGSAYASTGHTVDLRPPDQGQARPHQPNVAFFLWRLGAYPVAGAQAEPYAPGDTERFYVSPLRLDMPLFQLPRADAADKALALPEPIGPLAFGADPARFYGPGLSLLLSDPTAKAPIGAERVVGADLSHWTPPPPGKVAVDVKLGRIRFAPGEGTQSLRVHYTYGFSHDMGGGPYLRTPGSLEEQKAAIRVWGGGNKLQQAVNAWANSGNPEGVIEIVDSSTYVGELSYTPPPESRLIIRAADGQRPVIRITGSTRNIQILDDRPAAALHLIGLCIDGGIRIQKSIGQLTLSHCTLVPRPKAASGDDSAREVAHSSILACSSQAGSLQISLDHCVTGPLKLIDKMIGLTVSDSLIDGLGGPALVGPLGTFGPVTAMTHTTVLGLVRVREMTANGVLFGDPITAQRTQAGTVRYSYVPPGSAVPGLYRCPEHVVPVFTSVRYGDPAYGQLARTCPPAIAAGAEDGAEMGAFHELQQPQRERNLRTRLLEYLPVGREPGLIYVT